jgi:protein-S-isoprenylcysteine O-methyltransferase Ste14
MKRTVFFVYGIVCYVMFFAVYAYMAGFVGNLLVPKSIDSLPAGSAEPDPLPMAVAINLGLLLVFALQHSIMARPGFKRYWTQIVPKPIERSTYVLVSNLAVMLILWQWRAIPIVIWDATGPLKYVLWALFAAGWLLVPAVSLMISHFDLFGLRQVWLHFKQKEYTALPFHTPMLYSVVRHPLYVGWFMAFWMTPMMTVGHLLFAATLTVYMVVASKIEERDLVDYFGRRYEDYRRRVPAFVPRFRRGKSSELAPQEVST